MEITLTGSSNPWWLVWVAGFGLAAVVLSWRAWWMLAKAIAIGYWIAWRQIARL